MDTVVFTDSQVIKFFDTEMILVKVNIDSSVALTRSYGVTGFPTFVLLDKKGGEIDRTYGYHTAEELIKKLRSIQNHEGLFWDLVQTGRNISDRTLMLQLADGYRVRGLIPEAEGWYHRVIDGGDRADPVVVEARLNFGYMYYLVKDWDRMQTEYTRFLADYPKHQYVADIAMMLAHSHYEQKEFAEASEIYRKVIAEYPKAEGYVKTAQERLVEMEKVSKQ